MNDTVVQPAYAFEGFRLDAQHRVLSRANGEPIPLAPKVFDTLLYFVERPGQLIAKRELLEAIWPHVVVEENNLNQAISGLRRTLGETAGEHRFIVTAPGHGYRFVADVRIVSAADEAKPQPAAVVTGAAEVAAVGGPRVEKPAAGRRLAIALVTALALTAGWVWLIQREGAQPAASLVLPNSIAVLPFDNLSPDPNNAFFAAGIHDEVLNQLGKLKSLNVIARTSVMQYANAARPITEIARELNVETVMEGSVSYAEGRVAVRALLIDANTGVHLWSDSYDREFADVFGIQTDIAMNIANALDATFSDEKQENLERIPSTSPEAYALYLRAWAAWGSDRAAVDRYLDRAIELDPNFAQAYERKAINYSQMMIQTFGSPTPELDPAELYQLVQEHANKALDLDPSLGGAYGALGTAHRNYWHWTEAKRAFDRGREADPSFLGDAWFYAYFGEPALAVRSAERSVTLSPQDPFEHFYLGCTYLYLQRTDESIIALQNAVRLEPVVARYHFMLAQAYTQNGNAAEALQELRISRELFDDVLPFVADFAYIYARLGRDDEATNLVSEFEANLVPTQDTENSARRIKAALAKGDEAEALRWLRIAVAKVQNHEPDASFYSLMTIKHNFLADPVLEQPEFVVLRHELAGD